MQGFAEQPQVTGLQTLSSGRAQAGTAGSVQKRLNRSSRPSSRRLRRDVTGEWLIGARLAGEDLRGADFRDADLTDADLRGADLRGADLTRADLTQADLRGADLRGARLAEVRFRNARCDELTRWPANFHPAQHRELACEITHRPARSAFRWESHVMFGMVAGATFAVDQLAKALVRDTLPQGASPRWLPGDVLFLQRVENHGLNFQLLDGQGPILTVAMGLMLIALLGVWMTLSRRGTVAPHLLAGLALVFGGGLANALDRAVFGAVLDYIGVYGGSVINLADIAIFAGFLCFGMTRSSNPDRAPQPAHSTHRPVHAGVGV